MGRSIACYILGFVVVIMIYAAMVSPLSYVSDRQTEYHQELLTEIHKLESEVEELKAKLVEMESKEPVVIAEEPIDIPEAEVKEEPVNNIPAGPTNFYSYMDYRKITDETSRQYEIQQECSTNYLGIREYNGYYAVALGERYGTTLGDTWHVVLENNSEFDIILADCKADVYDGHPTVNYDNEECTNVIEFIVDEDYTPIIVLSAGTFTALDKFGGLTGSAGNIKSITYTGHVDI